MSKGYRIFHHSVISTLSTLPYATENTPYPPTNLPLPLPIRHSRSAIHHDHQGKFHAIYIQYQYVGIY